MATHTVVRRFIDKQTRQRLSAGQKVSYEGRRAEELEKRGFIRPIQKKTPDQENQS